MIKHILTIASVILCINPVFSQDISQVNPQIINEVWDAAWITHPDISGSEEGLYLFRKILEINEVPNKFVVNISADNRYKFYVNGMFVCNGPARGTLMNWYFENIDIAPFLIKGKNSVSAIVWNFGFN